MSTVEQPTCGNGLADNSVLPAFLTKLIESMAKNFEIHMKALDLTDKYSTLEFDAYEKLVRGLRQTAGQLHATADQMARYRDLPMGRHDQKAMSHTSVRQTFKIFVRQNKHFSRGWNKPPSGIVNYWT